MMSEERSNRLRTEAGTAGAGLWCPGQSRSQYPHQYQFRPRSGATSAEPGMKCDGDLILKYDNQKKAGPSYIKAVQLK